MTRHIGGPQTWHEAQRIKLSKGALLTHTLATCRRHCLAPSSSFANHTHVSLAPEGAQSLGWPNNTQPQQNPELCNPTLCTPPPSGLPTTVAPGVARALTTPQQAPLSSRWLRRSSDPLLRYPAYPRNPNSPYQTQLQPMGVPPRLGPPRTGGTASRPRYGAHATHRGAGDSLPASTARYSRPRLAFGRAGTAPPIYVIPGCSPGRHRLSRPPPPSALKLSAVNHNASGTTYPSAHAPSLAQDGWPPIVLARPITDRGSSRTLALGPDGSPGRPHYRGQFEEGPPLQRLTLLTGGTLSTLPPSHQCSHQAASLVTILHPPPLAAPQYQRSLASSRTRLCCTLQDL